VVLEDRWHRVAKFVLDMTTAASQADPPIALPAAAPQSQCCGDACSLCSLTQRKFMAGTLPGPFRDARDVGAVARRQPMTDARIDHFRMRVVPAVEFGDRFGIDITSFRLDKRSLLGMRCMRETLHLGND